MTSTYGGRTRAAVDRVFLERAYELAARGIGSTAPNPPVGAVIVRDGRIVGEGYHHLAGQAHAEANALEEAGDEARGATLYVSLEPCVCAGRVAACAPAIERAGIARVVAGTVDPNPKNRGLGAAYLRERGVDVEIGDDPQARALIESFAVAVASQRPFVALKMAMSLDGAITSQPGVQEWITSEEERLYVRELRIAYDAVMVGARTVRVDDPLLTVRPPHHRLRQFRRIVACGIETLPPESRILHAVEDYDRTIVLVPGGMRDAFAGLAETADVIPVGGDDAERLDLPAAMQALRQTGVESVLCEGGPTLGARLIESGVVDRFYWAIAPRLLGNERAVPVLAGVDFASLDRPLRFDRVEHVGHDVVISGRFLHV